MAEGIKRCTDCDLALFIKNGSQYLVPGDGLRVRADGDGFFRSCVTANDGSTEQIEKILVVGQKAKCIFKDRFVLIPEESIVESEV
jgi:hypothetical protein